MSVCLFIAYHVAMLSLHVSKNILCNLFLLKYKLYEVFYTKFFQIYGSMYYLVIDTAYWPCVWERFLYFSGFCSDCAIFSITKVCTSFTSKIIFMLTKTKTWMAQESDLDPDSMKVAELKYWLSQRKLSTKGKTQI